MKFMEGGSLCSTATPTRARRRRRAGHGGAGGPVSARTRRAPDGPKLSNILLDPQGESCTSATSAWPSRARTLPCRGWPPPCPTSSAPPYMAPEKAQTGVPHRQGHARSPEPMGHPYTALSDGNNSSLEVLRRKLNRSRRRRSHVRTIDRDLDNDRALLKRTPVCATARRRPARPPWTPAAASRSCAAYRRCG